MGTTVAGETIVKTRREKPARVRNERKEWAPLTQLILRLTPPTEFIVDPFAGTGGFSVAALRLVAGQFRRVLCSDKDAVAIASAQQRLLSEFVDQVRLENFRCFPAVTTDVVRAAEAVEAADVAAVSAAAESF